MAHGKDLGYSIGKIFIWLFALTALEVAWGFAFHHTSGLVAHMPKAPFWAGLLICGLIKGLLIFMYFMHMKFERWIVWCLIVPTPILVAVVLFANMPDTAFNDLRDHPVGYRIDKSGNVVNAVDPVHPALGLGNPHQHAEGAPAAGEAHH